MSYHVIGIPKVGNAMGYASGGGNAAAPGGDGSGLTAEQAKKLAGLPGTEQFGLVGFYSLANGARNMSDAYRTSGLLSLCRENDLVYRANAAGGASSVAFFAGDGSWISGRVSGAIEVTIPKSDFPADAVFFAVSTIKTYVDRAYYTNGETIEAREGAVCDAIRASKIALLADEWNVMWGAYGKYDPANAPDVGHPFMGNDIWMTYEEALDIMAVWSSNVIAEGCGAYLFMKCQNSPLVRTLPPLPIYNADLSWLLSGQTKLEVVRLGLYSSFAVKASATNISYILNNCTSLREVRGELALSAKAPSGMLISATDIPVEEFKITAISCNINLGHLPKLSLASMRHMVANAANTGAITVTVHAEVYSKLTGDTTNEAAAALSEEELAAWGEVLTEAAARNISFACA